MDLLVANSIIKGSKSKSEFFNTMKEKSKHKIKDTTFMNAKNDDTMETFSVYSIISNLTDFDFQDTYVTYLYCFWYI